MTPEQLQAVRAERWRQKSNPVLTLDDTAAWVNATGLCLFLPRRNQFLTPAPSFVEAATGAPSETPSPAAVGNARSLMIRLVESGTGLALNLFGMLSEQPDFLVSREAFPYIFSLRGGRNWKTPPPKATPLVTAIWRLLEDGVSLEVTEIQAALGHEITEAAVLRSLMDLWGGLRVTPLYAEDGPTRWALTQTRFEDVLKAANNIAQTTALSALVSLYLESVVAATPEEIETFLSPLTARSKVKEVVNGLAATRQLGMVPVGTQTMYHIAGSLPEFAEPEPEATAEPVPRVPSDRVRPTREERRPERRPPFERKRFADRAGREQPKREGFAARGGEGSERRRPFGRPPFRKFEEGKPRGKYPRREEAGGDRKSFTKRPYTPRPSGQRPYDRPARPFEGGSTEGRPDFRSRGGKFPPKKFGTEGGKFPPKKFGRSKFETGKFSGKPRDWEKRPFRKKQGPPEGKASDRPGVSERPERPQREWTPKPSGFSKSAKPGFGKSKFGAGRPGGSKFGGKKYGASQGPGKFGGKPGFKSGPRPGGTKPPFKKRKDKGNKGNKSSE